MNILGIGLAILCVSTSFSAVTENVASYVANSTVSGNLDEINNFDDESLDYDIKDGVIYGKDVTLTYTYDIESNVLTIGGTGDAAFPDSLSKYRDKVTKVIITEEINLITSRGFSNLINLQTVEIGSGVRTISYNAFEGDVSLSEITIPDTIEVVESHAFRGCISLREVPQMKKVKSYPMGLFEGCTGLTRFEVPSNVYSIGWNCFKGCTGLTKVIVRDTRLIENSQAFADCSGLKTIGPMGGDYDIEYKCYDEYFNTYFLSGMNYIEELTVPEYVYDMMTLYVNDCPNLKKVTITSYPQTINSYFSEDYDKSKLTICGYANTEVQAFAEKNGLKFESFGQISKLIFNANGGNFPKTEATISPGWREYDLVAGTRFSDIPTPTHPYFIFTGWYTERDGGEKINGPITVTEAEKTTFYAHWRAVGADVEKRSQREIANFIASTGFDLSKSYHSDTFDEMPSVASPYVLGKLSDETKQNSLKLLNIYRYVCGLNYNVTNVDNYDNLAQAGALCDAAIRELTHTPAKVADMPEDLYQMGYKGASCSNMGSGYACYNAFLVGCMRDGGSQANIKAVGHRRWMLNPNMLYTGLGRANNYYALCAFDESGYNGDDTSILPWPAENTPTELITLDGGTGAGNYGWSVSVDAALDINKVKVKMTRQSDGRVWNFDGSKKDGTIFADNSALGSVSGCIIFYPKLYTDDYKPGESYRIDVETGTLDFTYTVNFFSLSSPSDAPVVDDGKVTSIFSDVLPGKWYTTAIQYVYDHNIMTGYANKPLFGTSDPLTREQFATMLYRVAGEPGVTYNPNLFSDVPNGKFYSNAVTWCAQNGIVTGYVKDGVSTGMFGVGDRIERQQLAVMLYRYASFQGKDISARADTDSFPDKGKISTYAQDAISWCVGHGILGGKQLADGNYLDPKGQATRAECAAMIQRYLSK